MMVSNKPKILEDYKEKMDFYRKLGERTEELVKILMQQNKNKIHSIEQRTKSLESLMLKIENKQDKYSELNEITDLAGIRIITFYEDDVDVVAKIIEREFKVDQKNTIDKRKTLEPEVFGYLSLHYVVEHNDKRVNLPEYKDFKSYKIEIQIRSILQHAWAAIEHSSGYKVSLTIPKNIRRDFSRLAGLLELADKEFLSIRNKLIDYERDVSSNLKNMNTDILIDKVSLSAYINNSNNSKKADSKIANIIGKGVFKEHQNIDFIIRLLNVVGIKNLNELDKELVDYQELSIAIAEALYLSSILPRGIGIIALAYTKIAMLNDINRICNLLDKCGMNRNKLGNRLLKTFNEFNQKKH